MILWGGSFNDGTNHFLNDGARYDPAKDKWTPVTTNGAPAVAVRAVWIGTEMLVFSGGGTNWSMASRYNPALDIPTASITPRLSIDITSTNVLVRWVTSELGFTLQQAADLSLSNAWIDVTELPSTNGLTNLVLQNLNPSITNRFYRLRKP